jgi:hypothetical protein
MLLVERTRNRLERATVQIHREDAPHNRRLLVDYFDRVPEQSSLRIEDGSAGVSETRTSCRIASKVTTFQPTERLVSEIVKLEIAYE